MIADALPLQSAVAATIRASRSFVEEERTIIRAAYPVLAKGIPVSMEDLAEHAGVATSAVSNLLERHPGLARLNSQGRIESFLGLSLTPTPHRLVIGGVFLYAWCAWDTLFIPRLVGATARVTSTCPVTETKVSLTVTPNGIEDPAPAATVMSFASSCCDQDPGGVVGVSCDRIHFLASREASTHWIEANPGAQVLTLGEAWQLAWLFVTVCLGGVHSAEAKRAAP